MLTLDDEQCAPLSQLEEFFGVIANLSVIKCDETIVPDADPNETARQLKV